MTGSSTQGIKTVLHPVSDLATANVPDIEAKLAEVTAAAVTDPDGNVLGLLQGR